VIQGIDLKTLSHAEKDELILSLVGQLEAALARIGELEKRLARLERPATTPDNSSLPHRIPPTNVGRAADRSQDLLATPQGNRVGRGERLLEIVSATTIWHPGRMVPIRYVLVRDVAAELKPQAFLCTDLDANPLDIFRWFIRSWSTEVTFAEVRRHLRVETQRQRSDPAIARTTPALFGLFSLVTLWAHHLYPVAQPAPLTASWYHKSLPTFSDAIGAVRRQLWTRYNSDTSPSDRGIGKMPHAQNQRLDQGRLLAAKWPKPS
jgi:hypothetical protein